MINCYDKQQANGTTKDSASSVSLSSGSYVASKPFMDWAKWSHTWEGKSFGITLGKYKEGILGNGSTEQDAEKWAMENVWAPNNLDLIKDPSVAIACMWCCFWTGNAHLIYQAVENPDVYGGRPKPVPKGHFRISKELVNKINQQDPHRIFQKIKKQLGWFGQLSQSSVYHNGHRRRWYSVNFHEKLIHNDGTKYKVLPETEFLQMIEKL